MKFLPNHPSKPPSKLNSASLDITMIQTTERIKTKAVKTAAAIPKTGIKILPKMFFSLNVKAFLMNLKTFFNSEILREIITNIIMIFIITARIPQPVENVCFDKTPPPRIQARINQKAMKIVRPKNERIRNGFLVLVFSAIKTYLSIFLKFNL